MRRVRPRPRFHLADARPDILPAQFVATTPYGLPALPTHSWTALITLHLHRLAAALDLDPRRDIYGLEGFVSSLKQMAGWSAWVGEELGSRIGWKVRSPLSDPH